LTNPNSAQVTPAVSVSAEIKGESGNSVGSIASAEMTKPGGALFGVANGADPLKTVVPSFTMKSIRQSTPGVGCDQHVDSFADGRLRPGGGVQGDHHGADRIADSGRCKLDSDFDGGSIGDQWDVGAIVGAAGVDSGIWGHGVGDNVRDDVYFDECGRGTIVAGGDCVGRD
jgi:hypothetical protein